MANLRSKRFGDLNKEVVQSQPYFSSFNHIESYFESTPNHTSNPNQSVSDAGNINGMNNLKNMQSLGF